MTSEIVPSIPCILNGACSEDISKKKFGIAKILLDKSHLSDSSF
jgi:hypothetical protein